MSEKRGTFLSIITINTQFTFTQMVGKKGGKLLFLDRAAIIHCILHDQLVIIRLK